MNTTQQLVLVLPFVGALVAAAFLSQFASAADEQAMPPKAAPTATSAVAVLIPTQGNDVHGTVRFTKVAGGVRLVAEVKGLTPGKHGFHVHEFCDASAADGAGAGGHFNPTHEVHGAPMMEHRHEGDLGNLGADAAGHAVLDFVDTGLALEGASSIIGRGLVVHASPDDLKSQPVGNAGKRVAVGVIGIAKGP